MLAMICHVSERQIPRAACVFSGECLQVGPWVSAGRPLLAGCFISCTREMSGLVPWPEWLSKVCLAALRLFTPGRETPVSSYQQGLQEYLAEAEKGRTGDVCSFSGFIC